MLMQVATAQMLYMYRDAYRHAAALLVVSWRPAYRPGASGDPAAVCENRSDRGLSRRYAYPARVLVNI